MIQGIIFGIFKAVKLVENEFNGWDKKYPYQIKIRSIIIIPNGVSGKYLQQKIQMQKASGASPNLIKLNDDDFNQIMRNIKIELDRMSKFSDLPKDLNIPLPPNRL